MNSTKGQMDKDTSFPVSCKAIKKTEKVVNKNDKEINFLNESFLLFTSFLLLL